MQSAAIIHIADNGTDQQVAELYYQLFGKSISNCKPCQKTDARIELKIMAKKKAATEQLGKWQVNPEYVGCTIGGREVSLDDIDYWLKKFPKALIEVKDEKEAAESQATGQE